MSWYLIDHCKSDREQHTYCPDCRGQIPAFLARNVTMIGPRNAEDWTELQCEGCFKVYQRCPARSALVWQGNTLQCVREAGHRRAIPHTVSIDWEDGEDDAT